ncbi:hypothetical protein DFJ74DRAFT_774472 [Hyaloraphidium curvatum]|nr:hypothetical protein DFJ74DRAFT_774472 [Hyaloraphidium curvatum]
MAFASRAVHALLLPYFVTRLLGHLMRTDEPDGKEWSAFLGSGSGMKNFAMDSGGANKFSMCRIFVVNDKENEASWLWNSGLAGALAPHITDARIYGPTTVPFYLFASLEWPSLKEVTIDFGSTEFKGPEPSSFPCRFPALENLTIYADAAAHLCPTVMRIALAFLYLGLAAAALAGAADAAPQVVSAAAPGNVGVFRRSCADCDQASYCEYAYPGAPAGSVACVAYPQGDRRGLYRRYFADQCTLSSNDVVCSDELYDGMTTGTASPEECLRYCETQAGGNYIARHKTSGACTCWSTCSGYDAAAGYDLYFCNIHNDDELQRLIDGTAGKLVAVEFSAAWCEPCQLIAGRFETLPAEFPDAVFAKADVDACPRAGEALPDGLPHIALYWNGRRVGGVSGSDWSKTHDVVRSYYRPKLIPRTEKGREMLAEMERAEAAKAGAA